MLSDQESLKGEVECVVNDWSIIAVLYINTKRQLHTTLLSTLAITKTVLTFLKPSNEYQALPYPCHLSGICIVKLFYASTHCGQILDMENSAQPLTPLLTYHGSRVTTIKEGNEQN